ncbi:NAD-dependent epimerase/dehydratase family protein [Candidatus Woesearchaeota archaeon]|nr:NAD-dependent epimerase/dehydratase family protein [Candidatus Woesearchaeota archaeon]
MINNLLVVGGSGYLGSNFAKKFKSENPQFKVAVYDQVSPIQPDLLGSMDNFYSGDINDKNIENIVKNGKYNTLINFAAVRSNPLSKKLGGQIDYDFLDSSPLGRTNKYGVINLYGIAKRTGIKLIHVSTAEVYGRLDFEGEEDLQCKEESFCNPESPYAYSRYEGEKILLDGDYENAAIVRVSNYFGPAQPLYYLIPIYAVNTLVDKEAPLYPEGTWMDWVYLDDVLDGLSLVVKKGIGQKYCKEFKAEVYNLAGRSDKESRITHSMLLDYISNYYSSNVSTFNLSKNKRREYRAKRSINSDNLKLLGWNPNSDNREEFNKFLNKTLDWYRDNTWFWENELCSSKYKEWYAKTYGKEAVQLVNKSNQN